MNFNNFLYIFSFFNGVRTKRVTEGKHFFLRNYSGLSWHLRERRYLLMTKRGPVEYVFSLKHYLACFAVFLFGLCSSLTILSSFIINVIKDCDKQIQLRQREINELKQNQDYWKNKRKNIINIIKTAYENKLISSMPTGNKYQATIKSVRSKLIDNFENWSYSE